MLAYCSTGTTGQRWSLLDIEIRGWGGLCLDLQGGNTSSRTPIQMWSCGVLRGAHQRWTITDDGEIHYASSANCLTLPPEGDAYIAACSSPALQHFSFAAGGQIRLRSDPGECLDVEGWTDEQYLSGLGLPFNGERVRQFACLDAQLNQRWNVTGRIRHVSTGDCLKRIGGSERNGAGVEIAACGTVAAQEWDYYWRA